MERKIFIVSTERGSGKSLVAMGLLDAFQSLLPRVGYMKPVGQRYAEDERFDQDAILIRDVFGLGDPLECINPASIEDVHANKDVLYERIFDAYKGLSADKDLVVFEGTDYTSTVAALEFDINAELANNLAAPVLLVTSGLHKSLEQIVEGAREACESLRAHSCSLLGVVVNRFQSPDASRDSTELEQMLARDGIRLFGALPTHPPLSKPRLREVIQGLGAKIVYQGDDLGKVVADIKILAMSPERALGYMKDQSDCLLITPGDRDEMAMTVMAAQRSTNYPRFAGLVLTGGVIPGPNVRKLFKGQPGAGLTILSVPDDTYATALKVSEIRGEVTKEDKDKIALVNQLVAAHVDVERLHKKLGAVRTETVTPRMFQYRLLEMAKAQRTRIVLPEGNEPRILRAAAEVLSRGICDVVLLGDIEQMRQQARDLGLDLSKATLVDPKTSDPGVLEDYVQSLYELRKHKGMTLEMARELAPTPTYYATLMVHKDHADGFVSGATHSTADTLAPPLRIIKTKPGISLVSSVFFMCLADKVLVYGDCALVENPNAEQMAEIAVSAADTALAFGVEPRVALLSYSTGTSGKGKDVDKVREATEIARRLRPELAIEGPIQYDAAISEEVARIKVKGSSVAGKATVYIFPDLDAGNTAYKAVQRSANVPAIGPVLQGLNKPANDLSRGATVTDIVYTIAVTAIQARQVKEQRAGGGKGEASAAKAGKTKAARAKAG